jgi:hypothetical protein
MSDNQTSDGGEQVRRKLARLIIVLAGIVLGQAVLYGPSLAGRKILLPLDVLTAPGRYIPRTAQTEKIEIENLYTSDLLYLFEPCRRFAVSELRAGRIPMWAPFQYAGVPFIWPKFSPFCVLEACVKSPIVLAWTELVEAVVAGLGMYAFCRRVLRVSFWPATICAWCYPLTGFFVLWRGFATKLAVYWLPWILLAVDKTARRASPWAPIGLSVATGLTLVSGHLDVASQVLLVSGLYALWCLLDAYRGQWFQWQVRRAALALGFGWMLGFLLAAPYLLPVLEYTQTGARIAQRSAGAEERPPVGLAALPQTVLPDMYGSMKRGNLYFGSQSQIESSAQTYAGVLATLLVAPLAWCSRRHRSINVFWPGLAFFALSWCLNIPGFVHLLRLPGLNMASHNRLVFAASFAVLALTAVGLEVLTQSLVRWQRWFWMPVGALAGLCLWCIYRTTVLPEELGTTLPLAVLQGEQIDWVRDWARDLHGVRQAQAGFVECYAVAAVLCGAGIAGWLFLRLRPWNTQLLPLVGAALVGDLLWFAYGRSVQYDPSLYYPRIPLLDEVAKSTPGRVIGYQCLPANLAMMCGLRDIRGYDNVEPARFIEILTNAASPQSTPLPYAHVQWLVPKGTVTSEGAVRLPPVLDLLNVRYIIFRGSPPPTAHPAFQGPDYWVVVNSNVLERPFVPRRVETVAESRARVEKLASAQFDPREVAYVEEPVDLPALCRGQAEIVSEIPTRVTVALRMETPGLVVLADLWDKGWQAYLNGRPVPILRTNHAIRGVVVPAGSGTIEFQYAPASFAWGLRLSALGAITLLGWTGMTLFRRRLSIT